MSIRVMSKVFKYSESKLGARLVLLVLADGASDDGIVWFSQKTVAEMAKVAEGTVRDCLRTLERLGEVQTRKAAVGRTRINVYRVVMPGIPEPDYTRLPFELDAPFDDRRISTVDDRRISDPTTAGFPPNSAGLSSYREDPLEDPLVTPSVSPPDSVPANRPASVNRKPVTDDEYAYATAILAEFNEQAGTRFASTDWIAKLVARVREHPDLPFAAHQELIRQNLADPWWKGPASPSVIYGSGAQFERSLNAAAAPREVASREDLLTFGKTWGPGTPYETPEDARAGVIQGDYREHVDG